MEARSLRWLFRALVASALLLVLAVPAMARPALQQALPTGTVVSLEGTPHLWIADEQGALHWGGDTRALEGHFVNWGDRRPVNLAQLRSFRLADPWLSAGLLKSGDPIHLVKWETNQARPTLLHVQSIADVELFGINGSNYGNFVLDQSAWEQRFGMSASTLQKGTLAPAVQQAAPTATVTKTPSTLRTREVAVNRSNNIPVPRFETVLEVAGAPLGQRLTVRLEYEEYVCAPECTSTGKGTCGPLDAGPVNSAGILTFRDSHGPYKAYTYTFADVAGNTVSISLSDDLKR
jgi:hypothetical protein